MKSKFTIMLQSQNNNTDSENKRDHPLQRTLQKQVF